MTASLQTERISGQVGGGRSLGFPQKLIPWILCPKDGGALATETEPQADRILNGRVVCALCACEFEIREGILRLLPVQAPLDATTDGERQARDLGATQYEDHFSKEENTGELYMLCATPEQFRAKRVLDLGCGTGRLTRIFAATATATVGVDLSEASLRHFAQSVGPDSTIGLIWGNAVDVRFAEESFDVVVSTQVLEHIPEHEMRVRFLRQIHATLKTGGALLLTAYYYSWARRLLRRQPYGFHSNGIFYHRFTASEIRRELGEGYELVETHPLQPDRRVLSKLRWAKARLPQPLRSILAVFVGQLLYVRSVKTAR
jgi:SAM-dependent methyltransferase